MRAKSRAIALLLTVSIAAALAGCASGPAEPKPEIRRFTLIPVASPLHVSTANKTLALPLVPALIVSSIDNRWKSARFDEKLASVRKAMGEKMTAALLKELAAQGFEVTLLENVHRPADDPDAIDYKRLPTREPVLHVTFDEVGMYAGRLSIDYQPKVNVSAQLWARPGDKAWLVSETFFFGADSSGDDDWSAPADPKYRYPDFDTLMSKSDEVAESYDVAIQALAKRVASQLRAQL
ncbi:hypothetical protein QTI24_08420 [Variovorax sp. J22P240]|uniref:hypothetical protein n=1 Tax=Variovorax sp. J22P240 TaxID=3053514 RepID=UPI0025760543|nr:hypothetical protein [Variovorax sp. J22P240]MDL9998620.1 hypothetical protein [Variovorax sp. J22P240]